MEAYRNLTPRVENELSRVEIGEGKRPVVLETDFKEAVSEAIGPDQDETGSVCGYLRRLTFGDSRNAFAVYPVIGPEKIIGTFGNSLRKKFADGADKYVIIHGTLKYKSWDTFPYAIRATDIEICEILESPGLSGLRGMTSGVAGASFEEVLEKRRNGWISERERGANDHKTKGDEVRLRATDVQRRAL